jgi:hypothetical protein
MSEYKELALLDVQQVSDGLGFNSGPAERNALSLDQTDKRYRLR